MFAPASIGIGNGKVLICGNDARKLKRGNITSTAAIKETWIYDILANKWTPLSDGLDLRGSRWLTAANSSNQNVAILVAFGPWRRTYALRYDEKVQSRPKLHGAPGGTVAWKYPEQKESLENAPAPNPQKHQDWLAEIPVNTFVDTKPPGYLISKTWSTAVMDTDRSEVIYTGGGHSGYSGNDVARYSIANNRWTLDQPPCFPPFLEGTNAGIYGWSYGMIPFSQHTYLWYAYDTLSKKVIYLARPSLPDGIDVQISDDPASRFVYNSKEHGYASWVYDSATKKMHRPTFGRPFKNPWHLTLTGTPDGVYAACDNNLYLAKVNEDGTINWKQVGSGFPKPTEEIKYHYEYQPLIFDSKRNRLLQLKGDKETVHVFERDLGLEKTWKQLDVQGKASIGREAFYIEKHDTVLWLGDKLHALNCTTNEMRELDVQWPKGLYGHECAFVYDSKHDLCVALLPASFSGKMQTFLFRYQPAKDH